MEMIDLRNLITDCISSHKENIKIRKCKIGFKIIYNGNFKYVHVERYDGDPYTTNVNEIKRHIKNLIKGK